MRLAGGGGRTRESWISEMYDAFCGDSVTKKSSWLTDKLGAAIASPAFTLVDDGRLVRGVGTSPWDGEGVPTRRTVLVDGGPVRGVRVRHVQRAPREDALHG